MDKEMVTPELLKKIKGVEILPFLFAYIELISYLCSGKTASARGPTSNSDLPVRNVKIVLKTTIDLHISKNSVTFAS